MLNRKTPVIVNPLALMVIGISLIIRPGDLNRNMEYWFRKIFTHEKLSLRIPEGSTRVKKRDKIKSFEVLKERFNACIGFIIFYGSG
jgi:hypothetical protein